MFITLSLVAVLIAPIASFSYPVFGTKRYHRAINANKGIMPVYSAPYYDEPILAPTFPRYPSDTSNYYYVPRRESQYYGLPTYRGEYKPTQYYYAHSPSYYDDRSDQANPLDDLHEEMLHEDQRDRLRDYSIGQETWYENPAAARQDKLTNVFLKNLIAYNKEQLNEEPELDDGQNGEFDEYSDGNDAEYYDQPSNNNLNIRKYSNHQQQHQNSFKENEDKDVMDLNSLAANSYNKEPISQSNYPDYQQDFSNTYEEEDPEYDDDTWINWSSKRSGGNADQPIKPIGLATFSDRKPSTEQHLHKPIVSVPTTKQAPSKPSSAETTTTAQHNDNAKGSKTGQKEIVLPRPATPVRTPFSEPLMEMLTHNAIHDKRQGPGNSKTKSPSTVYDTIRQLLAMEQNLDKTATETKVQKRFVSNEESLVHQLNGLRESKKV